MATSTSTYKSLLPKPTTLYNVISNSHHEWLFNIIYQHNDHYFIKKYVIYLSHHNSIYNTMDMNLVPLYMEKVLINCILC